MSSSTDVSGAAASVYERARLTEIIAASNQQSPTANAGSGAASTASSHHHHSLLQSTAHTQANARAVLYASALAQLSKELAKVKHVGWEKISRVCALCPPVPPTSSSPALHHLWSTLSSEVFEQPILPSEIRADGEASASLDQDDDGADAESMSLRWDHSGRRLNVIESIEVIDSRIDAVWALARYLILAEMAGESPTTSHLGKLLPLLLRFFVSLPFFQYDTVNFPHLTPKFLAQTLLNHLSELARQVPASRKATASCVIKMIQLVGEASKKKADTLIGAEVHYTAVLEGLLLSLGDTPFPFTRARATELSEELHKLFLAKYLMPQPLYGATLRAMTTLMAYHPDVYEADRIKYLFEHEFMRCTFTYPLQQPVNAANGAPGLARRPSTGGLGGTGPEATQTLILVQTINIGVLVGLMAQSKPSATSKANCTEADEESYKQRALHKLKELLDSLLNIHADPSSNAPPSVVIGCVDAARAILNGVMELANKYRSDRQSIPSIVEAIKTILLSSRRLAKHPKEKQLRYLLTLSLSKIFKLELLAMQQALEKKNAIHRSTSSQSLTEQKKHKVRPHLSLIEAEDIEVEVPRLVRSTSTASLSSGANAALGFIQFSNSFTRNFVQTLLAQLYKEEAAGTQIDIEQKDATAGSTSTGAGTSSSRAALYPRILVLLLDLVSMIDFAPLTQLVLPNLVQRFLTRPKYLHLVITQLTDVALMEERRYAESVAAPGGRAVSFQDEDGAAELSPSTTPLASELKVFDQVLHLLLHAYMNREENLTSAAHTSKKALIEIPSALQRMANDIKSPELKIYLLKRVLKLTLDLSVEIRNEELAMAQQLAEQSKKKKGSSSATAASSTSGGKDGLSANPVNRAESCGFLLPIIASLMRECYLEQVENKQQASPAANASQPTIGLQLYSNSESNAKWFRRLWFFLTSFHFTDAIVSGSAGSNTVGSTPASSLESWSTSIKTIALYSPLLVNPHVHIDFLSTELSKEYDVAFKAKAVARNSNSAREMTSASSDKINAKLNVALQESFRKQLIALFPPTLSYDLSQLPIGRVLFLLSVFHLETIRIKASNGAFGILAQDFANQSKGQAGAVTVRSTASSPHFVLSGFHALFAYLSHYPLNRMGLLKFFSAMGDHLFLLIANHVCTEEISPRNQSEIEGIISFLLKKLASRFSIDRSTSRVFLQKLTKQNPHLQWSAACLSTLLEILQIVQESLETSVILQPQQHMKRKMQGVSPSLPQYAARNEFLVLKSQLDLPDEMQQRMEIHATLLQLSSTWLDNAKLIVPDHASLVVQEFIQKMQRNLPRSTGVDSWHSSFQLLLRSSHTLLPQAHPFYDPTVAWGQGALPTIVGGLSIKERYLGEIKGLYRSYQEFSDRRRKDWFKSQRAESSTGSVAAESNENVDEKERVNFDTESTTDSDAKLSDSEGEDADDARPSLSGIRSMSVLIAQESADAFRHLLARHMRSATLNAPNSPNPNEGPQIPPFGKLITAKLILEGNQILASYHSIIVEAEGDDYANASATGGVVEETPDRKKRQAVKVEKLAALHARFERLLNLTAALLVWSTRSNSPSADLQIDQQDLLHLLVKTPVQLFTSESMHACVFVWKWLLHSDRSFELPLFIEMAAAWTYTVDRQVGLFSHRKVARNQSKEQEKKSQTKVSGEDNMQPPPILLTSKSAATPAPADKPTSDNFSTSAPATPSDLSPEEVIAPHLTWINFLLSHFKYLPSFSRDIVNLLAGMLHKAFARPETNLNTSQASFGTRFRLLLLGIRLIQGSGEPGAAGSSPSAAAGANSNVSANLSLLDLRERQLLRDRVYLAALNWFNNSTGWYDPTSPQQLQADVQIILDFLNALKKEEGFWMEGTALAAKAQAPSTDDASYPLSAHSHVATSAIKIRLEQLTKQRNLLVFLLSHELDRIYTWQSPLAASMTLPPQGAFTTHRGIYAPEWRTLISTAWSISPKLCVRFCQRFQQSHIVLAEITSLVQANPSAVYDLPEAVVYLVTEDSLQKADRDPENSVLRHLIYWTPTTLPTAIWFLGAPFCQNRLVLEYAVHTLRSHPTENVMFYLSQIIQSVRNDSKDRILTNFLLQSSKVSILLSHQLLWLAQAELGEAKATTKYVVTPFRIQMEQLIKDIIAGFDEVEREFFNQEFQFFEQITAISGILKPIPTKQGRKDKIKEELQKIQLTTHNIYLPTNPQLQVVDIICTSGAPMQSAAKVPILVAFKVKLGELDLMEERKRQRLKSIAAPKQQQIQVITDEDEEEKKSSGGADADEKAAGMNNDESGELDEKAKAEAASAEVSRLEAEAIELLVDPELSETEAGPNQALTTSLAREKAAKLAVAKSTADASGVMVQACIFKVGDDVRQDALALQVIQWCKNIMQSAGLDLFLSPYRVLPNRTGGTDGLIGGIIECVPNASTRDEIGKSNAVSLLDHFINKFGPPESASFQLAQRRFILSAAGYAVTSFILQVKDRHNGNVMFDDDGHMVHIDFGFIFDISPARNMKFESAGFKLTLEMVELMGSDGKTASPMFRWFQELVIRGFLAVREHRSEILALVEPMLISSLECFKPNSLSGLKARFFPDVDEKDAAMSMLQIVNDAYDKWTTNVYDRIQKAQQNVFFFPGTSASDPEKHLQLQHAEDDTTY